jgi:hypothetical protein
MTTKVNPDRVELPAAFEKLAVYSEWILENEEARRGKCDDSSMDQITLFYKDMLTSLEQVLEHLNQFPLDKLPVAETNLLSLVLSYVEAAISVEMFEQPEIPFGVSVDRFRPLHHLVP